MSKLLQRILAVCFLVFCVPSAFGGDSFSYQSTLAIADRQLGIDRESQELVQKQFLDLKTSKDQQLQLLQDKGINPNVLKHAQLDLIAAQAAVEGSNIALTDVKEALDDTDNSIKGLEKNLQEILLLAKGVTGREDQIISIEARLEFLKRLQQIQQDRVQALRQIKTLNEQRLTLENKWQQKLQTLYAQQEQEERRNRLSEVLSDLQQEQQRWLQKLNQLTTQLQMLSSNGQMGDAYLKKTHLAILEAEENIASIKLKSYLVHIQNRVENLQDDKDDAQNTTNRLNDLCQQVSNILTQLDSTEQFMEGKIKFLALKKNELNSDVNKQLLSYQDMYAYSQTLNNLMDDYKKQIKEVDELVSKGQNYQRQFKLQLQHHLSERQKFPSNLNGWMMLGQKLLQIPYLLVNAFDNFMRQSFEALDASNLASLIFTLICLPFLLGGWFYLRRYLLNIENMIHKNKQRFSTNFVYIILELVRRNLGSVLAFLVFLGLTYVLNFTTSLFLYLFVLYLGLKVLLTVARLLLLEKTDDLSGTDVRLYYRMRLSLILGFFLSSLTITAHLLPVAYEAKIAVNRLFMVFILLIAIQLFKARKVVPDLLATIVQVPKKYFYRVVKLLTWLIPLALFSNAVVGLCGYVELAWTIAKYQLVFITVLASYLIIRGVMIDGMEYLSELFIRYIKQGWLWTEAFLKPLDRVLRVVLFLLSVVFLTHLYHLDNNELFIDSVKEFLHQRLFTVGGNEINALLLCELVVIFSLIKWLAHWSREFSYRWLYVRAKDLGVRNSLAVFTQYASVIVSVLIGLKFLGLDLTGFTVVAAAFAAGIGFGMRDLIVNFFSGILLLIERPFRTGDIITLGIYEGEVVHTGMRSMTIRTWDHMEVIVPNADMFTKPFVNWTHHDNIVRTVITLKLHREDDPHKVHNLIIDLLKNHKSVAKDPAPEVIMNELSEALIEMQVRYYVFLTPQRTRIGVRSQVLFAIWDCFKAHNIRAPNPQYDLIVKTKHNEDILEGGLVG